MPCGYYWTSVTYSLMFFYKLIQVYNTFSLCFLTISVMIMEHTLPPLLTPEMTCSAASKTTANGGCFNGFVEQEENLFTDSPKRGSSDWTDEKHTLYLKSMEDSFVNQLYNSSDMQNGKIENKCSSNSSSSRGIHASNHCPSGQFKALQHKFWSRIGSKRENLVCNETNRPEVSSTNTWIQHFRTGNKHGATKDKPLITSCSDTVNNIAEVMDQNFVEEDYGVQMMNTVCSKKRKTTYAVQSGNDQAAAFFGHISCNRNHRQPNF